MSEERWCVVADNRNNPRFKVGTPCVLLVWSTERGRAYWWGISASGRPVCNWARLRDVDNVRAVLDPEHGDSRPMTGPLEKMRRVAADIQDRGDYLRSVWSVS